MNSFFFGMIIGIFLMTVVGILVLKLQERQLNRDRPVHVIIRDSWNGTNASFSIVGLCTDLHRVENYCIDRNREGQGKGSYAPVYCYETHTIDGEQPWKS